jgi:hypothetical protein
MVGLRAGGAGIGRHGCEGGQCALGRGNKARGYIEIRLWRALFAFAKRKITIYHDLQGG